LVNFNDKPFEDMLSSEIDKALKYLLDHEMISMSWDPDAEDMVFYMTDKQKGMPKPEDWDEAI
jgi:K+-sensing histidine kinase KdpD